MTMPEREDRLVSHPVEGLAYTRSPVTKINQETPETIIGYPTIQSKNREIELDVSSKLRNQPWFLPIKAQLQKFLVFEENWNGYGESSIHEEAVNQAIAVLDKIVSETTPKPDIVPTSRGGIQIEWVSTDFEIEVEILPTGPAQIIIVESSGQERECQADSTSEMWGTLRDILERMGRESLA